MEPLRKLPLTHQTMFAELTARCMDAAFDRDFPENGSFVEVTVKGRGYWYYSGYQPHAEPGTARSRRYVDPLTTGLSRSGWPHSAEARKTMSIAG